MNYQDLEYGIIWEELSALKYSKKIFPDPGHSSCCGLFQSQILHDRALQCWMGHAYFWWIVQINKTCIKFRCLKINVLIKSSFFFMAILIFLMYSWLNYYMYKRKFVDSILHFSVSQKELIIKTNYQIGNADCLLIKGNIALIIYTP